MLRNKFWKGLRKPLKDISGHKFDCIKDFDELRVTIRELELEQDKQKIETTKKPNPSKMASAHEDQSEIKELKGLVLQMKAEFTTLQQQVSDLHQYKYDQSSFQQQHYQPSAKSKQGYQSKQESQRPYEEQNQQQTNKGWNSYLKSNQGSQQSQPNSNSGQNRGRGRGAKFLSEVQWTAALRLYDYKGFHSTNILNYHIPSGTFELYFELRGASSAKSCPERPANIYIQHGSYPVISPYNESFPEKFYLKRTDLQHVSLQTNNNSIPISIRNPRPGIWYLAAFLPKTEEKITQKGLSSQNCMYGLNVEVVSTVQADIEDISMEKTTRVRLPVTDHVQLLRYMPSEGVYEYVVVIDRCSVVKGHNVTNVTSCPVSIDVSMETLPLEGSNGTVSQDCDKTSLPCQVNIQSPVIMAWNYLKISSISKEENISYVDVHIKFETSKCLLNLLSLKTKKSNQIQPDSIFPTNSTSINYTIEARSSHSHHHCVLLMGFGRLSLARDDFSTAFVFSDANYFPIPRTLLLVPDSIVLVAYLNLNAAKDSGGTFKIVLETTDNVLESTQDGTIWFCMMRGTIPNLTSVRTCPGGISLQVNTTTDDSMSDKLYIPYPEEGRWYIGVSSMCYHKNNSGSVEYCKHSPALKMDLSVMKCVDNGCGQFGACQEFISGILVFSACKCYAGWRGYGCSDGTEAESDATMLTSTLLLTLSNLLFIPGILVALYRRYFVEAFVYTYTMFFSTFYHACDTNAVVHHYCMMKYDVLSYCDFLGSITSFWVTILAMARLKDGLRSFLHMLGAMFLALGVEYDRHGLWVFVVPAVTGVIIMIISWMIQCYKRKGCFPSKWRYLKFLLPGVLLAGTGLVIFAFLETEDNYKYTHSAWHVVMALCIIFLLPSRSKTDKDLKWYIREGRGEEVVSMLKDAADGDDSDEEDQENSNISHSGGHVEPLNSSSRNLVL